MAVIPPLTLPTTRNAPSPDRAETVGSWMPLSRTAVCTAVSSWDSPKWRSTSAVELASIETKSGSVRSTSLRYSPIWFLKELPVSSSPLPASVLKVIRNEL